MHTSYYYDVTPNTWPCWHSTNLNQYFCIILHGKPFATISIKFWHRNLSIIPDRKYCFCSKNLNHTWYSSYENLRYSLMWSTWRNWGLSSLEKRRLRGTLLFSTTTWKEVVVRWVLASQLTSQRRRGNGLRLHQRKFQFLY